MPCNSDYLLRSSQEVQLSDTAKNLKWLLKKLGKPIPDWLNVACKEYYCRELRSAPLLCNTLKSMTKKEKGIFRAYCIAMDKKALKVALWWAEHKKADRKRLREEKKAQLNSELRKQALSKLTEAEKDALGVSVKKE